MSSEQPHDPAPEKEPPTGPLPGALLRQAREAARMSEEDVARELRMTVGKVRALEADDYEQLHSDTFIRGYLRTYAKLLGLDPDEVLDAYRQARRSAGLGEEPEENPIKINVPEPTRSMWKFVFWILLLLVGIWALSVWFLGNNQPDLDDASFNEAAEGANAARDSSPAEALSAGLEEEPLTDETREALAQAPESDGRDDTGQNGADTGQAAPDEDGDVVNGGDVEPLTATQDTGTSDFNDPEVLDQLTLAFSDECWVEVTDGRGDVLVADLLRSDSELALSGERPFTVKLGNAEAVSVALNGEPVEFVPPSSGRTLTLTVE